MGKIEWTDKTWNFITGCTQISPACDNCYAKAMTKRLQGMATIPKYKFGWDTIIFHKDYMKQILDTKKYPKGSKIFVCSMSDLFHKDISYTNIAEAFFYMANRKDCIFQVLTKRADRMLEYFIEYKNDWLQEINESEFYRNHTLHYGHIWLGVTAENQRYADERIPRLLDVKRLLGDINVFVSIEPMLGEIDLSPYIHEKGLDWVIIGGEKVPNNPKKARLMRYEWVKNIKDICHSHNIPLFFKQWGNNPASKFVSNCDIKQFPKEIRSSINQVLC